MCVPHRLIFHLKQKFENNITTIRVKNNKFNQFKVRAGLPHYYSIYRENISFKKRTNKQNKGDDGLQGKKQLIKDQEHRWI